MTDWNAVLHALDLIEDRDARYLTWGLTDESWSDSELLALLGTLSSNPDDLLAELVDANLVFELPGTWPQRYRTRMSETVRLLANLRQMFPQRPWRAAPGLVSDFRFGHVPRKFPIRDISPDAVTDRMARFGPALVAAVHTVLGTRSLSKFQYRATEAVLEAISETTDSGVVVGAGTGSGKTLAFYLPAFSFLINEKLSGGKRSVIALYPRNELLKDQLMTAIAEVRSIRASGGPQLRVGAYFGPTPASSKYEPSTRDGWRRVQEIWVCPYLTCPEAQSGTSERCSGDLGWSNQDRKKGVERLVCLRCSSEVAESEFALTRDSMQSAAPDLLFSTTEMLNRNLCNGWSMSVFGVGPHATRSPALVLLDEIHTYEGATGAQTAFALRRWRHLLRQSVTWVGLSATLLDAPGFFGSLCGLSETLVEEVVPEPDELVEHGREYQVVLRGDPASQTALLSTSIQSIMLLRRILDREWTGPGETVFGSKLFVFGDNLDLVNRLYRQVLSAEGLNPFGRPDPQGAMLAGLRMPVHAQRWGPIADWSDREAHGQHWWFLDRLGFGDRALAVTRTSSQDSGVDTLADVVVATASLEVGYDDPAVGAVLQHKAPRDVAQFLQRKGRAGRVQRQRPWTVVVLSDYGRDRQAYLDYETLLDPSLPPKSLPLGNQSVRKMQSALCLIDWVAQRYSAKHPNRRVNWRRVFSQPTGESEADARRFASTLLAGVIGATYERDDLVRFVGRALRLEADSLASVCWDPPRSLLLEVVPTAHRQIRSNWSATSAGAEVQRASPWIADRPLPDFIPKTLFSDLALPEVEIEPPAGYDPSAETSLPIAMALSELAPGRVTLRWAVRKVRGLWIPPASTGTLVLDQFISDDSYVLRHVSNAGSSLPIIRPTSIKPQVPPPDVLPSSNGRMAWQFMCEPLSDSVELSRPVSGPLTDVIIDVRAYLHAARGALRTWRFSTESTSNTARHSGRERHTAGFEWKQQPVALGAEFDVDSLEFFVRPPTSIQDFQLTSEPERLRQLRSDRFLWAVSRDLEATSIDPFLAKWVADTAHAVAAKTAIEGPTDLSSLTAKGPSDWRLLAEEVVGGIVLGEDGAAPDEPLRDDVLDAFLRADVVAAVAGSVHVLSDDPDEEWLPWVRARYLETVAAAIQSAAQQLCSDFDLDEDCLVDVVDGGDGIVRVFLSDALVGGGGLVETLTRRLSEDPRRFDYLVVSALRPSDLEMVDLSLRKALELVVDDSEVSALATKFRRSSDQERLDSWKSLLRRLVANGVNPSHATTSALSNRVFRSGSSPASDMLLRSVVAAFDAMQIAAGFSIDLRTACWLLSNDSNIEIELSKATQGAVVQGNRLWAHSVLLSLLWTPGVARRPHSLRTSNRFRPEPAPTERTLVLTSLAETVPTVDIDEGSWVDRFHETIAGSGRVSILSTSGDNDSLARALEAIAVEPVEIGWMHVHPRLELISLVGTSFVAEVVLDEVTQ